MKRTIIVASAVFSLAVTLWVGFGFGIYYQARVGCAFTANQVLRTRLLLTPPEGPADGAKRADELVARWEARADNVTLLEAFDPSNIPGLLSLTNEQRLLRINQEGKKRLLAETSQR